MMNNLYRVNPLVLVAVEQLSFYSRIFYPLASLHHGSQLAPEHIAHILAIFPLFCLLGHRDEEKRAERSVSLQGE